MTKLHAAPVAALVDLYETSKEQIEHAQSAPEKAKHTVFMLSAALDAQMMWAFTSKWHPSAEIARKHLDCFPRMTPIRDIRNHYFQSIREYKNHVRTK